MSHGSNNWKPKYKISRQVFQVAKNLSLSLPKSKRPNQSMCRSPKWIRRWKMLMIKRVRSLLLYQKKATEFQWDLTLPASTTGQIASVTLVRPKNLERRQHPMVCLLKLDLWLPSSSLVRLNLQNKFKAAPSRQSIVRLFAIANNAGLWLDRPASDASNSTLPWEATMRRRRRRGFATTVVSTGTIIRLTTRPKSSTIWTFDCRSTPHAL